MTELKLCPHCGAKMMRYRHTLSKSLINALYQFARVAKLRPMNLKAAGLTRNQWDNFQKLKYFGLVTQIPPNGKKGVWKVTNLGADFLSRRTKIHSVAITYRGKVVKREGDVISCSQGEGYYFSREHYAETATPTEE